VRFFVADFGFTASSTSESRAALVSRFLLFKNYSSSSLGPISTSSDILLTYCFTGDSFLGEDCFTDEFFLGVGYRDGVFYFKGLFLLLLTPERVSILLFTAVYVGNATGAGCWGAASDF
jgi:hypothetical protein